MPTIQHAPRLARFVSEMDFLLQQPLTETQLLPRVRAMLAELVAVDDWLPQDKARPHSRQYQQYLLHADPDDRYSIVSFVWGPGQGTPIHNHTVWGAIGMLRGAECSQRYLQGEQGLQSDGPEQTLTPGEVELVSPTLGDIHSVRNASRDEPAISIHVYGGNIGMIERSVFDKNGGARRFVSGYSS